MTMNDEDTQKGSGAGEKPPGDPAPEPHRRESSGQDAPATDDAEGGAAQDEAALLWPEREVTLSDGTQVTVAEMTWGQSMRLTRHWRPLADGLLELVGEAADEREIGEDEVTALLEDHGDDAIELLAECTNLDRARIQELSLLDGQTLLVTWLGVHLRFFGRRLAVGRSVSAGLRRGMRVARSTAGRSAPSS